MRRPLFLAVLLLAATGALAQPAEPPRFGPPPGEGPPPMGPPPAAGGGPVSGPNLRGMASEFFAAPMQRGQRVLACPGNQPDQMRCAAATADRTCVAANWRASQHFMLQTERGQVFLADLLCANVN